MLENPQHFLRARAGAGVKSRNSCGRGRARGPNLKILAGAGGRGGQKRKILRARAGAGARKAPQAPARAPAGKYMQISNFFGLFLCSSKNLRYNYSKQAPRSFVDDKFC